MARSLSDFCATNLTLSSLAPLSAKCLRTMSWLCRAAVMAAEGQTLSVLSQIVEIHQILNIFNEFFMV